MSRILFLTQVLPYPLDAGPKVRAYYMLRHLAGKHEVTLVSFVRPDDKLEYVEHLRQITQAVHTVAIHRSLLRDLRAALKGLLSGVPIMIARDDSPEMDALLRRLTRETSFDLIHADQINMAHYGQLAAQLLRSCVREDHPASAFNPLPFTMLDEHNAVYRLAERMAAEAGGMRRAIARREARAFRRYEAEMARSYDAVLTVTDEDRQLLLNLFDERERCRQAARLTVVPICVDPDRVQVVKKQGDSRALPAAPTILHLGTMYWPPNVSGVLWFVQQVMPLIWARLPDARFVIVGKKPPAKVRALAADPRIEVAGYVADPLPYLQAADAFVVPLLSGGGMRVKILDAWLWGLPTVSTQIGAEGIDLRDGENILLADDAASIAEATLRVLTDPALNQHLRAQGRAWVEAVYDWRKVYPRVDAIINTPPSR
jgi:glycosyltransferase involved in cell wall biosynthesis